MKLYYSAGSCSLASHITICELGLPVKLERVSLRTKATDSGRNLSSVHPKGYVPLLEFTDGTVLSEGPAILQYLADLHPESQLAPRAGTFERYRLQEWLTFIGTELHKAWSPLFYPGTSEEQKDAIRSKLESRLEIVAAELGRHLFLLGGNFNVADAYLFTVLRWAKPTRVILPTTIATYMLHVGSRPAVREALLREGLVTS